METQGITLKIIYPAEMSREYMIPEDGLIIGRSADANFVLEDEWISRKHCRVFWKEGEVWVEDLGSTNGTFLDGSEVTVAVLEMESNLQLGKIVMKLDYASTPVNSLLETGETHPLTGLKSYRSATVDIEDFFNRNPQASFFNITMRYAEVAREDFGPDASDFLTYEVGRILSREILSDEILVHGNDFQYFLLSPEANKESCEELTTELAKVCAKQVFSFEGSPLQGDIDTSWGCGNFADAKEFIHHVL